jgi:MarR family 2-MHQ and catechol resistance regulon transcriptional repressor
MGERYLKSVRLLAECLQGFERFSGESVRSSGLTHAQFDIIATLGNTPGMTYKELATFEAVFPSVVAHGRQLFASYTDADFDAMDQTLRKLKQLITDHSTCPTTQQQKEEY